MPSDYPQLSADDEGVWRQDQPGRRFGIRWDEVHRLSGHKLDCIDTVDTVVELDFEYGHHLELNSTWRGFSNVMATIGTRLPGIRTDWFTQIEKLGVGEKPVTVWKKQSG